MHEDSSKQKVIDSYFNAVERQPHDQIIRLLDEFPWLLNELDKNGNAALHIAVLNNDIVLVNLLTARKCQINIQNPNHNATPLHYAVDRSNADIVALLLSVGASISQVDVNNRTPLKLAQDLLSEISSVGSERSKKLAQIIERLTAPVQLSHDRQSEPLLHPQGNNTAYQEFTGAGRSDQCDYRRYKTWYSDQILCYLLHSQANSKMLPFVFISQDTKADLMFDKQLEQLAILKNSLNKDIAFIAMEPGTVGNPHFVCGILSGNKLLIINPTGQTNHKDFYTKLAALKKSLGLEVYLSDDKIQLDPNGLVSCGPICAETTMELLQHTAEKCFSQLSTRESNTQREGLVFTLVSIANLLPISLKNLPSEVEEYMGRIMQIRGSHADQLLAAGLTVRQTDYWDKHGLQADIQVLLLRMLTERIGILDILSSQEYIRLAAALTSEIEVARQAPPTLISQHGIVNVDSITTVRDDIEFQKGMEEYLYLLDSIKLSSSQIEKVKQIINSYPEFSNIKGRHGQTILHLAAHSENIELLNFLVSRRIDNINITDNYGNTPLHIAVSTGNIKTVTAILKIFPDISIKNHEDLTPEQWARKLLKEAKSSFEKTPFEIIAGALSEHEKQLTQIRVPKTIHFIWAGGIKQLPPPSVAVVSEWAIQNPGFEIFLWVDAKTSGKTGTDEEKLMQIAKEYYDSFKEHLGTETQVCYKSACYGTVTNAAKIVIKDIEEEQISSEYIRHEIERARPNYGASSDMLRYRILHRFGGAYFDSDIKPPSGGNPLIKPVQLKDFSIFREPLQQHHLFYLEHQTQLPNIKITPETLREFKLTQDSRVGNDAFICTAFNPVMKRIADEVEHNYYGGPSYLAPKTGIIKHPRTSLLITMAYGASDRRFTIFMTGPEQIRFVLNKVLTLEQGKSKEEMRALLEEQITEPSSLQTTPTTKTKAGTSQKVPDTDDEGLGGLFELEEETSFAPEKHFRTTIFSLLKPLRCQSYCLTDPLPNTLNWLKPIINKQNTDMEAINCIKNSIIFEVSKFKILRLDDHIIDLKIMLDKIPGQSIPIEKVTAIVLEELKHLISSKKINLEEIQCAQCLLIHPEVVDFYKEFNLSDRTFLKEHINLVMPHACSINMMQEINVSKNVTNDFDVTILEEAMFRMETGLKFISKLVDHHHINSVDDITSCINVFDIYEKTINAISQNKDPDLLARLVQIHTKLASTKVAIEDCKRNLEGGVRPPRLGA